MEKKPIIRVQTPLFSRIRAWIPELLLVLTTIIWGSTFTVTNNLTQIIPPMFYMGIRYLIGFFGFLPFINHLKRLSWQHVKYVLIAGTLCWISFALQTLGIKLTSATKSAFITGLNVIMVPIFVAVIFRTRVKVMIWLSAFLALLGITVMSLTGFKSLSIGDLYVFISDIFYAFFIIYLDRHLKEVDPIGFSLLLVGILAGYSLVTSAIFESWITLFGNVTQIFTLKNSGAMIYMGIIASTVATLTQIFGQRSVSATRAAIIFAFEPIFATIFAVIIGPEHFTLPVIGGGILIFLGMLLSIERKHIQLPPVPSQEKDTIPPSP